MSRCVVRSSEEGAVAVVTALVLTVLLMFAALTLDLGALRVDRAASQSAADMSAAAAAQVYEPAETGSTRQACEEAVVFAEANLGVTLSPQGLGTDCDVFPMAPCTPGLTRTAAFVGTAGSGDGITVTITNPVSDGDGLMGTQPQGSLDGTDCQRVGVAIQRDRSFVLAPIAGFNQGSTTAQAVGVATSTGDEGIASLIVLQPSGCETISTVGQHLIRVDDAGDFPGIITVDTESCTANNRTIFDPANSNHINIQANRVRSYGLRQGADRVLPTQSQALNSIVTSAGPGAVEPGPFVSRLTIDHRFNCKSAYDAGPIWSPATHDLLEVFTSGDESLDCDTAAPEAPTGPYIEDLHNEFSGYTAAEASGDGTWSVFPDDLSGPGASCSDSSLQLGPGGNVSGAGTASNWFINCPELRPTNLRFLGVDTIVAAGAFRLQSSNSRLEVDGGSGGAIIYGKDGVNIDRRGSGAQFVFRNVFVYLQNGLVDIRSGNSAGLTWEALPIAAADNCAYTGDRPNAECFAPLALWSNGSGVHSIGGSAGLNMRGTYFIPNAELALNGTSDFDLRAAQMYVNRISGNGNATTILAPDPNFNVPSTGQPFRALIR